MNPLAWPKRLLRAALRLLQDTTGLRPIDAGELEELNRLLEDEKR